MKKGTIMFNPNKVSEKRRVEAKELLISEILLLQTAIENKLQPLNDENWSLLQKYFFIESKSFNYNGKPIRAKDNWVDFIRIYKGVFSLWKPKVQFCWALLEENASLNQHYFEDTIKGVSIFRNDVLKFNHNDLRHLKTNLETLNDEVNILLRETHTVVK